MYTSSCKRNKTHTSSNRCFQLLNVKFLYSILILNVAEMKHPCCGLLLCYYVTLNKYFQALKEIDSSNGADVRNPSPHALAGVAQRTECQPANQTVSSSIPNQGTYLGCKPGPQLGACKRQPHIDVSLPLFLPPFPYL